MIVTAIFTFLSKLGAKAAAVLAIAATGLFFLLHVFMKGKEAQRNADAAERLKEVAQAGQTAVKVQQAAQAATQNVPAPPPPDVEKRDDLNTTE